MAERYVEMVIDGPSGWDLGFIRGFLRGRALGGGVLDAEAEGFDCGSLRERLREVLHPGRETLHLLVPEDLVPTVREAVAESKSAGHPMAIRHERPLTGARFKFEMRVSSREHGKRFLDRLQHLPAGARHAEGTRFDEKEDPNARGVELYAPTHEYELVARGGVEGDLLPVLELYRFCRGEDLIHQDGAELVGE
jgi:hypothetical protein